MDTKPKILYVDDEQINLLLFESNFEDKYDIITAESGIEALQILKSNKSFHLIISDMNMPGMNGVEFITELKKQNPDQKCIILTGYNISAEIENAIHKKIIMKCLTKPFDLSAIEKAVQNALV